MSMNCKTSWLDDIQREFETVSHQLDEAIERAKTRRELSKKQIELESQIAQQRKLNEDLNKQLHDLSQRTVDVDNMCNLIKSHLKIADSDKSKLENARELYQIGKELTGVRFDFEYCSQHPNTVKGYLMNQSRHLLESFQMEKNSDALWDLVANIFDVHDQDNHPQNNK